MKAKPIGGQLVSPAELNRRVAIEYPTRVADGMGGQTVTWTTKDTVWAKISTLRTDEAILGMQNTSTAIHNVVIRYRTDVLSSWRITYGGKHYNIIGPPIDINKAHRYLDIKVKEAT